MQEQLTEAEWIRRVYKMKVDELEEKIKNMEDILSVTRAELDEARAINGHEKCNNIKSIIARSIDILREAQSE